MSKPILYIIIALETIGLLVMGAILITTRNEPPKTTSPTIEPAVPITAREMTVYVKSAGTGEKVTDVVGKMYVQDEATGRGEFLFDLGAGCFPTWTLNPQDGYNLMVTDEVDIASAPLEQLMREGQLSYAFRVNGDLEIRKVMGIRSASLHYNGQVLRLNQQCS